jgi:DNA repair protein RecO (recombination protein O)
MSMEKSDAIVLRSVEWSETSLVVTLWTRGFGKVSAIAKGARRLKSPFESALDLLSISSVVFLMKSGDALDLLTEAKLQRRFKSSQSGLLPLYCGYYAADLIQSLTEHHQPIPGLMELLEQTLADLDAEQSPASVTLRLELHTMQLLGVLPSLDFCIGCGEALDTSRTSVPYSVTGGGVVCVGCALVQHPVFRIQTETWNTLRRVSESQLSDPVPTIDRPFRSEVRWLMEHVIGHLADRRLRLMDYLEELKR